MLIGKNLSSIKITLNSNNYLRVFHQLPHKYEIHKALLSVIYLAKQDTALLERIYTPAIHMKSATFSEVMESCVRQES